VAQTSYKRINLLATLEWGGLALLVGWLFLRLSPGLIFSPNEIAGGDYNGHLVAFHTLLTKFLPSGHIGGWLPDWFGGMPLFQFYFPLPFLFAALLTTVLPEWVGFKFTVALSILALPVASFLFAKLVRWKSPLTLAAALATLPLLFRETGIPWGGAIVSVTAGEFAYSWGISFSLIFSGLLFRAWEKNKLYVISPFALVATTLSHLIPAVWAIITAVLFLVGLPNFKLRKHNASILVKILVIAALLSSFWVVPFLANLDLATPLSATFTATLSEVFPFTFWPLLVLSAFGYLRWRSLSNSARFGLLLLPAAILLFFLLVSLQSDPLRAIPLIELGVLIGSVATLSLFSRKLQLTGITILAIFLLLSLPIAKNTLWRERIERDFSGFETKTGWDEYWPMVETTKSLPGNERIFGERSDLLVSASSPAYLGGNRAFATLPYFNGRWMVTGHLRESALNTPHVLSMETELSSVSCPLAKLFPCPPESVENFADHLRWFNARWVLAVSERAKTSLSNNSQFRLQSTSGPFSLYELADGEFGYVTIPDFEPLSLQNTKNWKKEAYEWFHDQSWLPYPIIISGERKAPETLDGLDKNEAKPIDKTACTINESMEDERISFRTTCPALPHIIKVAYHPRWKVAGAKKVELVTPGFMLVYPEQDEVTLTYGSTWADTLGKILTLLGIGYLVVRPRLGKSKKNVG
jgi:hypothetical protein